MLTSEFASRVKALKGPVYVSGDGRLTPMNKRQEAALVSSVSDGRASVRIDGMSVDDGSPLDMSRCMSNVIANAHRADRDYDVLVNGSSMIQILSRTPGALTSVTDMYASVSDNGQWFSSPKRANLISSEISDSIACWCDMFGYGDPSAMYAMADASGYKNPVERLAFANRVGHVASGLEMPLRSFDDGYFAQGVGIRKSLVESANDKVRGISRSRSSRVESLEDATVADVVTGVMSSGHSSEDVYYVKGRGVCLVGNCASEVAASLNEAVCQYRVESERERVSEAEHAPKPEAKPKTRQRCAPKSEAKLTLKSNLVMPSKSRVDSVRAWMRELEVGFDDLIVVDKRRGANLCDFVLSGTPVRKSDIKWFEDAMGICDGMAFSGNMDVRHVHTNKARRELPGVQSLASVVGHMGRGDFRFVAYDAGRSSVAFERVDKVNLEAFDRFLATGFSNDVDRDMASAIIAKTIANGANPEVERIMSRGLGVPVNGGIAEASAAAVMDSALGLRTPVAGYDRETCMDAVCVAVSDMVDSASRDDVSVSVERLFARNGHLVDVSECPDKVLREMASTPGHVDHLPWSERDDYGNWHSIVCVNDVFFVEDERGITAYPRFDESDVESAYNILCASVNGFKNNGLQNLSDKSDAVSASRQYQVNESVANRNHDLGKVKPSSHLRKGFFGLRVCGPGSADYRITYVSACSVGDDPIRCDLSRVHKAVDTGTLSNQNLAEFLGDKVLDGRDRMFAAHQRISATNPRVRPFKSKDDVVVEIHTNDSHLMDGVDTHGAKWRLVLNESAGSSAHSGADLELG